MLILKFQLFTSSSWGEFLYFAMSFDCTRPQGGFFAPVDCNFYCELISNGAAFHRSLVLWNFRGTPSGSFTCASLLGSCGFYQLWTDLIIMF